MTFNLGNTSVFGSTTTTAPTFSFGTATSTPAARPFGQTGFSFGTPAATTSTFSLGTATPSTGFGFGSSFTSTAPTNTGFGGFGGGGFNTNTIANTTTTGGFGSYGGGFGTATTTSTPSFGFGQTQSTPLFSGGFGQTQTTTNTTNTGFAGFGGFGTTKPLGTGTTTGFGGGFGAATGLGSAFGQGVGQPQQPQLGLGVSPAVSALEALYNSVFKVNIFGDERDQVLKQWNLLQAIWGFGKGYYAPNVPPVDYTPENPLCRFKAIGYSRKPSAEAKDGLVAIIFNKKDSDIRAQETQLISSLMSLLGNKPNLSVHLDSIKAMSHTKSQVLFYVEEKQPSGLPMSKRVANSELVNYMLQPMQKQNLTNMGAENVYPFATDVQEQIKEYLDTPPAGIDPRLWKQGQLDNPDPIKFLPVPIVGFEALRWRSKCQEQETKIHQAVLDQVAENIAELKRKNSDTIAKIAEHKQRIMQLGHRVLQILVKQEVTRNIGLALRPEEEVLHSQLESLHSQINNPAHFKNRLNELVSLMRMQREETLQAQTDRYYMEPHTQFEIYQYLSEQHKAMVEVMDTVNTDLRDLKIMSERMQTILINQSR